MVIYYYPKITFINIILGEITLDKVAHVKDETVRFLEKRSFDLVSFTYSYEPERAPEINKMLEDDLDNLLLNSHRQLAYHRLYGDNKSNVALYNSNLRRLEILAREVEACYDRFQTVKNNNPDPTKYFLTHNIRLIILIIVQSCNYTHIWS